jgi:hypothetical protein
MIVVTADQKNSRTSADAVDSTIADITKRWGGSLVLEPARTVGSVATPVGVTVRESRGPAFVAARAAVERAKRSQSRCAVGSEPNTVEATTLEAFINLLVLLRDKRSEQGWAMYDLTAEGLSQVDAAARLGITAQSASQRSRAAGLRIEQAATVAIASLMNELDTEGASAR